MEQVETMKSKPTWHNVPIKGNWRLIYKVGNSQGSSAFGGYHLPVYPNPFTSQKTYLKNADDKALNGYLIDKVAKMLKPDEDVNEKHLVSWLICHPEVKLKGINDVDQEILSKKRSSKITLECLDINEMDKFQEEDYIDKLIGLLTLDFGKNALSILKIRYVMAYLGMTYREPRYEGNVEKSALRSRLKSFAKSSYENAELVNGAITDMDDAQNMYEFKELVRLKILNMINGVYKFQNAPIGSDYASVNAFFSNHPEVKTEVLARLYK
jgi:hypothetical protein